MATAGGLNSHAAKLYRIRKTICSMLIKRFESNSRCFSQEDDEATALTSQHNLSMTCRGYNVPEEDADMDPETFTSKVRTADALQATSGATSCEAFPPTDTALKFLAIAVWRNPQPGRPGNVGC